MTATPTPPTTAGELVDRAHALKPLLVRNAAEVDSGRRVVDESIAALRRTTPTTA